ncbi:HAD-IA family hydrolase [Thiogranum longum]|uniref:HAD-IA family hydrolase n=1 Tax=Thiogranum longum TaxID=1537524 RepID=UPI001FB28ED6|nr:HAD-IA family hydrolase [Thiogranum longum]
MKNLPSAVQLIVFDWDGTLMDSETQIVHALQASIQDMALEERSIDECRNIIGLGLHEAIETLYPGREEDFAARFVERYRHHWFSDTQHSDLFPGSRETLTLLKDAGFMLGVATGKGRIGLDRVLADTGLGNLFSVTRCSDETRSKPHPQMLNEILQETGIEARHALMVGDTEYDLKMANEAGIGPVAVNYGVHAPERLLQHNPLVCLDTITELVDWLAEQQLLDPGCIKQEILAL